LRSLYARLSGHDVLTRLDAITAELDRLRGLTEQTNHYVLELNHLVRSGSAESLPLLQGYMDRLRTDAESAVGATMVIDRQLQRLGDLVETLVGQDTDNAR
jgi:hypothetical protein